MVEPTDRQFGLEMLRRQQARESLINFSQSMELPGVPLSATLDAEDPATRRLVDPVERVRWAFKPIETRVALHHALTMAVMQRAMLKPRGRAMIFEPPGAAKSTYACAASAWYMGKFPDSAIIYTSYASPIAAKQSRRVRAICRDVDYSAIWPEHPLLLDDQRAIDDWSLTNGSSFLSAGLLAGITGNRADGLMIDDPVQNREQADSSTIRTKTYEEFVDTATTRAKPSMWIILIQCMVGATRVTMADGTEKALRDIRPGDIVASYENGRLIPARILRWRNNGLDRVFTIKTKSGNIATANGRHPFLVHQSGKYVWVRLRDLKPGYHMVIASAKCKGFCPSHYNITRWRDGVRPPSCNKRSRRNAHLKHRYGITLDEYGALLVKQGGLCAVCKQPPGKNVRKHWKGKLCVDHCHESGKIRGLLCNDCNLTVGYGKSESVLRVAADYVRDN